MIIIYIFAGVISLCILYRLWYRIKYPFLSIQPIFHHYKWYYWFLEPGIINFDMPKPSKYYDETFYFSNFSSLSSTTWREFTEFINHHLSYANITYKPNIKFLQALFYGKKTAISLNYDEETLYEKQKPITRKKIISSITTRPINIYIKQRKIRTLFADYLCINKDYIHEKKDIVSSTIYTHIVNTSKNRNYKRDLHNNYYIYCFKEPRLIRNFVPYFSFDNYTFNIKSLVNIPYRILPLTKIHVINDSNAQLLYDIIPLIKDTFHTAFLLDIPVLLNLIKIGYFKIVVALHNIQTVSVFIFTDDFTTYNGNRIINLISSFNNGINDVEFYNLFICSLRQLKSFDLLLLNNLANNNTLLEKLQIRSLWKSPMSYYFYNCALKPIKPQDVILMY